jgi:hypothetical protein
MFKKRHHFPLPAAAPRSQGQAMVEYLVVTAVIAAAMFVPSPLTANMSLADYLARAVRSFFRAYSFLLSVT